MKNEYMIWSNEHRAWWRPLKRGYTPRHRDAGYYTRDEAFDICKEANRHPAPEEGPNEIPVRREDWETTL